MSLDSTVVRPPGERRRHTPGPCLLFVRGSGVAGQRVALDVEVLLGRDPGCAVPLIADDVSRQHARITPQEGGHVLADLASTNGTFVNGARVTLARLAPGDRISVGPFEARYVGASAAGGAGGAAWLEDLALLSDLSRTDALTGIANRRAFDEALPREVARAHALGAPLALVAFDIDHFKRVNDAHGHAVGDAVLGEVARRAEGALREEDLLARTGGEEFAVLLPGATLDEARAIAERIREAVAGAPVAAGGASLAVTVSLGCAVLGATDGAGDLAVRADERLYAAKHAGRNQVVA